jgi:hypothetical protein
METARSGQVWFGLVWSGLVWSGQVRLKLELGSIQANGPGLSLTGAGGRGFAGLRAVQSCRGSRQGQAGSGRCLLGEDAGACVRMRERLKYNAHMHKTLRPGTKQLTRPLTLPLHTILHRVVSTVWDKNTLAQVTH